MKIDRLLSVLFYLLHRNRATAREVSECFHVLMHTIQPDLIALSDAGIPALSIQGSHGGFAIMDTYKPDRLLVDTDDLFFILTAPESISIACQNMEPLQITEKMKTLVRNVQSMEFRKRKE